MQQAQGVISDKACFAWDCRLSDHIGDAVTEVGDRTRAAECSIEDADLDNPGQSARGRQALDAVDRRRRRPTQEANRGSANARTRKFVRHSASKSNAGANKVRSGRAANEIGDQSAREPGIDLDHDRPPGGETHFNVCGTAQMAGRCDGTFGMCGNGSKN